ncbi:CopG family transcriptional regulator [Streptomyces sp. M10(2022)]
MLDAKPDTLCRISLPIRGRVSGGRKSAGSFACGDETDRLVVHKLYYRRMALKRTNVYADDEDLALIKEAAARVGVSEAELIREGIHRIALARRIWDQPFVEDGETFDLGGPLAREAVREAVTEGFDERETRNRGHAA